MSARGPADRRRRRRRPCRLEPSVGPERELAAVVVRVRLRDEEPLLPRAEQRLRAGRVRAVLGDARVAVRVGVVDVEAAVLRVAAGGTRPRAGLARRPTARVGVMSRNGAARCGRSRRRGSARSARRRRARRGSFAAPRRGRASRALRSDGVNEHCRAAAALRLATGSAASREASTGRTQSAADERCW